MRNERLYVTGMTCTACAGSIESFLKHEDGIESVAVNYANSTVQLVYDEERISLTQISEIVDDLGYHLILPSDNDRAQAEEQHLANFEQLKKNTLGAFLFATPLFVLGMFFMHWHPGHWISWACATPLLFVFGRQFFTSAIKQARKGTTSMDTLVALSTGVAYTYSVVNLLFPEFLRARGIEPHLYFEAAGVIIAFILLGKYLEERAKHVSSQAIKQLIELQPDTLVVVTEHGDELRSIQQVEQGMYIRVRPGDRIPVDGIIREGDTYIDESSVTGEPLPVRKTVGDEVISGTLNQLGSVVFEATRVGKDTFLAQVIELVKNAQGSKAPVQRLVDRISSVFVPVVMGIALLSAVTWWIFGEQHAFVYGLNALVTVLVIACPCALGLATPTAIVTAMGTAARKGILIKDATALEKLSQVTDLIVDKTGTLTSGKPTVHHVAFLPETTDEELGIWLGMETQSEHPLAHAVCAYLKKVNPELIPIIPESFESLTGKGMEALHSGIPFAIVSFEEAERREARGLSDLLHKLPDQPGTLIVLIKANRAHGILVIQDELKATTAEAIKELKQKGMRIHMLTGDNARVAHHIGEQLGISSIQASCLPADKGNYIRTLQQEGKVVAMAGDGINDSEALALADVGIAMGKGSDIAKDVAKMTLLNSDLRLIGQAMTLSKQTGKVIHQNLFWAFVYNVLSIPIAAGILIPLNGFMLNPMLAGGAMALSSVSVVLNSLRLRRSN